MAALFALTNAFFITSEGWFGRAPCSLFFRSLLLKESSFLLHSENVIRLEALAEKISTGSRPDFKTEPNTSADPIKAWIEALPLMQTFC